MDNLTDWDYELYVDERLQAFLLPYKNARGEWRQGHKYYVMRVDAEAKKKFLKSRGLGGED